MIVISTRVVCFVHFTCNGNVHNLYTMFELEKSNRVFDRFRESAQVMYKSTELETLGNRSVCFLYGRSSENENYLKSWRRFAQQLKEERTGTYRCDSIR